MAAEVAVSSVSTLALVGSESDHSGITGTVALASTSTLSVGTPVDFPAGPAALASTSTLAITGIQGSVVSVFGAAVASTSRLAITGITGITGAVAVSSTSRLRIEGENFIDLLTGSTLQVTGVAGVIGSAAVGSTSALSLAGHPQSVGSPDLSSQSTLAIAGTAGIVGAVAVRSASTLQGTGRAELVGVVQLDSASTLAITGGSGILGSVALITPASLLAIAGQVPFVGTVALASRSNLAITGAGGPGGLASLISRSILAAEGYSGIVGTVELVTPVTALSIDGHIEVVGTVRLVTPAGHLSLIGSTGASGADPLAYFMHTESHALTEFTNYGFNSMAKFNGVYLGATADGIFALTGAKDENTAIAAVIRSGISDFGSRAVKRIQHCWVEYEADGDMDLTVIVDGGQRWTYRLKHTGNAGFHGHHVQLGKGLESVAWQIELANVNGSWFAMHRVELEPEILRRRHAGRRGGVDA